MQIDRGKGLQLFHYFENEVWALTFQSVYLFKFGLLSEEDALVFQMQDLSEHQFPILSTVDEASNQSES